MSTLRSVGLFVAGCCVGALVAVATLRATDDAARPDTPAQTARASSVREAAVPVPPQARAAESISSRARPQEPFESIGLEATATHDAEWTALVEGMLETEVERRFGHRLAPERKQRLLAQLARLREASLGLQQESSQTAAQDAAALRRRLTQQVAIVEADRVFREELGIGVSEFVQGVDAGAVEEVRTASAQ